MIQEVQDTREFANNRSAFVVRIHDGSIDNDTQKVKAMKLTIYFDTTPAQTLTKCTQMTPDGEYWKEFIDKQLQSKTAVSFFCISGAQDEDGKFCFRTTRNAFLAKGVGTKAEKLNSDAALRSLQVADTTAFETQERTTAGREARDWSIEPGKETRCKLLSTFARTSTGVPELDDGETIWQLNWVQIAEPSGQQNIKSNDGSRIWFPLTLSDESGTVVLYITEKAALKLGNVTDAAEFEQLHLENRLRFPFWASVKVWRRPSAAQPATSEDSAAQPDPTAKQHNNNFNCFIVDAAEQDMQAAPSVHTTMLLPMLCNSVDSVLPATLGMVRKSEHYTMAVQYTTQEVPQELHKAASKTEAGVSMLRPCSRVVALVLSTRRSKVSDAGASGHKLVTDDVVDFFPTSSDATATKYTLTSFCTLNTVTDFKLDPPGRAKSQAALISLSGVLEADTDSAGQPVKSLLVDNVQLLTPVEAESMKLILSKMMYFAALAGQISRKRENEPWGTEESPAKASACRILGRSPTGPALPDYMPLH